MREWLTKRWRAVVAWFALGLAVVLGLVFARRKAGDPLAQAEGRSDVLRERARAKEREAELLGERREEIQREIAASETESEKAREEIQGASMTALAERWKHGNP